MDDAKDSGDVNEPMQQVPAPAAKPPDHAGRGRDRQRQHGDERREADGDERPLVDVLPHRFREIAHRRPGDDAVGKIETGEPIGDHVGQKMQRAVEEREQANHPAETDRTGPSGEPPQRCDRERDAEKTQRPDAGFVGEIAERIRAQVAGDRRPDEPGHRPEAREKHKRLQHESNNAIGDVQSAP